MSSNIEYIEKKLSEQVDALTLSNKNLSTNLVTITQAKSVCAEAKTSSASSATEAKQYRDQASQIAGLDDVAGVMGLLSKVYGVHDLDIPFNDGIGVTHGYGPVSFSRLSEATDINKSGQIQTFAADEPAITSKGCAFFGKVTNHVTNWNEVAWSEATTTPTPKNRLIERDVALTPGGKMEADRITASQDLDQQRIYIAAGNSLGNGDSWSVTVKAEISDRVVIKTSSGQGSYGLMVNLLDGSIISDNVLGKYEVEPLVDGWFRITIFGDLGSGLVVGWVQLLDSNNNPTFNGSTEPASVLVCNAQRSDGAFVPPPVPTSGSAVTREGEIATAPQIGNLPRPGDPFYIVVDVDKTASDTTCVIIANIYTNPSYVGVNGANKILFYKGSGAGNSASFARSKVKARYVFAFSSNGVACYEDGVKLGGNALDMVTGKSLGSTLNIGHYSSGSSSLNGYMKRLRIKHGVMTDDLAKAYGKWGD